MTGPLASDRSRRRVRLRPSLEGLEARSLMANAGGLDPTFGVGGSYSAPANPGDFTGLAKTSIIAVEKDNSVVVGGIAGKQGSTTFGLIHLTAAGTLDTSFGKGGEADVPLPAGNVSISDLGTLLIQPDGKIVVAGNFVPTGSPAAPPGSIVARFNADGTPDATFGAGGVVVFSANDAAIGGASVQHGTLQLDGKIVLGGTAPESRAATIGTEVAVIRLDADGSLDATFGTKGLVLLSDRTPLQITVPPATYEEATALATQPDGKVVVVADLLQPVIGVVNPSREAEVFRLDADGTVDPTLSQSGLQSVAHQPTANDVKVQPDGKILVLSFEGYSVTDAHEGLVRLNADGSLDGTGVLSSLLGLIGVSDSLGLQPNGDVVTSAFANSLAGGSIAAFRLTPNLTPDATFGSAGKVTVPAPVPAGSHMGNYYNPLAIAPDGKIVMTGFTSSATGNPSSFFVTRLTSTGSAHPGDFTGDGIADPAVYLPASGAFAVRPSGGGPDQISPFGIAGPGQTIPAPGDYTGSGREEIAAYIPASATYAYRPSGGGPDVLVPFGIAGPGRTIPAPGDYEGTGKDDIAVYLPSLGAFGIRPSGGGPDRIVPFGMPGLGKSIPVPGDYDGSGKTELAVYMPSIGAFAYRPANGGPDVLTYFGAAGAGNSIPAPGDYDGSGRTEYAVYLPSLGEFAYRPAGGGADVAIPFGIAGAGQSLPAPGDYTGSGRTEPGVYLPSLGVLAYRPAGGGPDVLVPFGIAGPGQTIPVTVVVPSPFPGTPTASAASIDVPGLAADSEPSGPSPVAARKKAGHGLGSTNGLT